MNLGDQMNEAAKKGDIKTIDTLLAKGADIDGDDYGCPLAWAAYGNQYEAVQHLLIKGAYLHGLNDLALRFAANKGHLDIVKLFVDLGADVNAKDGEVLGTAANMGRLETVKFLISQGADIHMGNEKALRMAAMAHNKVMTKFLLSLKPGLDVAFKQLATDEYWSDGSFLVNRCNVEIPKETAEYLRAERRDFLKKIIIRKHVPRAQPRKEPKPSYRHAQN